MNCPGSRICSLPIITAQSVRGSAAACTVRRGGINCLCIRINSVIGSIRICSVCAVRIQSRIRIRSSVRIASVQALIIRGIRRVFWILRIFGIFLVGIFLISGLFLVCVVIAAAKESLEEISHLIPEAFLLGLFIQSL